MPSKMAGFVDSSTAFDARFAGNTCSYAQAGEALMLPWWPTLTRVAPTFVPFSRR